jgi:hypothetical protein
MTIGGGGNEILFYSNVWGCVCTGMWVGQSARCLRNLLCGWRSKAGPCVFLVSLGSFCVAAEWTIRVDLYGVRALIVCASKCVG